MPCLAVFAVVVAIVVVERVRNRSDSSGPPRTVVGSDGFTPIKLGVSKGGGADIGDAAPSFRLTGPDGSLVSLAEFRGKPVLVNFWATWCAPCRREIPDLVALQQEWGEQVQILGVDLNEPADVVAEYARNLGMNYPLPLDADGSVAAAYRLTGLPETFFLDSGGVLRDHRIGLLRPEVARCIVANLEREGYKPRDCR